MDRLTPKTETDGELFLETLEKEIQPSKTLKMHIYDKRLHGFITAQKEAIAQMIYKYVNTEKGDYYIYPTFGLKKKDVFYKPKTFAYHKLCGRIKEDLEWDDRIKSVDGFVYDKENSKKRDLAMHFSVHSIYGDLTYEGVVHLG